MATQVFSFGGLTVTRQEPAKCCHIPDDQQEAARSGKPYQRCQRPAEWEITGAKEAGYPTLACTEHVGALLGAGLHYVTPWPDDPTPPAES